MIKAPGWASHAVPTLKGWEDPNTGELLKSGRHTQAQIDEFMGHSTAEILIEPTMDWDKEAEMGSDAIDMEMMTEEGDMDTMENMTKLELEAMGREHGIELDRRQSKTTLIEQLKDAIN